MAGKIPISTAKFVARKHGLSQCLLIGWDGEFVHVVTYGETKADCEAAAKAQDFWTGKIREFSFRGDQAQIVKEPIGWEFQQSTPAQAYGSFDLLIDEDIARLDPDERNDMAELLAPPPEAGGKELREKMERLAAEFEQNAAFYTKAGHAAVDAGNPDGPNAIAGGVTFDTCAKRLRLALAGASQP